MTAAEGVIAYPRLRAPRGHGERLIKPPLSVAERLVAETADTLDIDIQGRSLHDLARQARRELIIDAREYTSRYRDVPLVEPEAPVLLAGHQPELFHPGVWSKNFALGELAARTNGHAVNLLIDNDDVAEAGIRVPTGDPAAPRVEFIAYDRPSMAMPYEERRIADRATYASFLDRVVQAISPLVAKPVVRDLWPFAMQAVADGALLGQSIARSRHALEGAWGLNTCELPLSRVAQTTPFRWFVAHLLAHSARFRDVHNKCLAEYRTANHIRSNSHPVPALSLSGEWLETPFWVWTTEAPRRRRLFARYRQGHLDLSDLLDLHLNAMPLSEDQSADCAVEWLAEHERGGIKLRPRALVTTMYSRVFLGDTFLHGIGGAKYDQLTDAIVERFLGVEPRPFIVVTATAHLPVARPGVSADDIRQLDLRLRDLRYHPELHVPVNSDSQRWINQKREWIHRQESPQLLRERHVRITAANEALQSFLTADRECIISERERLERLMRVERILGSREYAFCLFPEETLRTLLDF